MQALKDMLDAGAVHPFEEFLQRKAVLPLLADLRRHQSKDLWKRATEEGMLYVLENIASSIPIPQEVLDAEPREFTLVRRVIDKKTGEVSMVEEHRMVSPAAHHKARTYHSITGEMRRVADNWRDGELQKDGTRNGGIIRDYLRFPLEANGGRLPIGMEWVHPLSCSLNKAPGDKQVFDVEKFTQTVEAAVGTLKGASQEDVDRAQRQVNGMSPLEYSLVLKTLWDRYQKTEQGPQFGALRVQ